MPYKSSKYTKAENQQMEMAVLGVLAESPEAMTIEQICAADMSLTGRTSQKIARVLGNLEEMGLVRKGKSKSSSRMMYKSTAVMISQGYEV